MTSQTNEENSDIVSPQLTWDYLIGIIALQIRQSLELPKILQTTTDNTQEILQCDRVILYKFSPDKSGEVVVETVSDPQWSILGKVVYDPCFESCGLTSEPENQVRVIHNIIESNLTDCYIQFLASFHVQANLVATILHQSQVWGLLIAHNCRDIRNWESKEIQGFQQIAVHVSIAINQDSILTELEDKKAKLAEYNPRFTELLATTNSDVNENEDLNGLIFQNNDIRQQEPKESEKNEVILELQHSQERLKYFFDRASDLIQSVSLENNKFIYVNHAWLETLGYSSQEIDLLTIFDVIHPDCLPSCQKILEDLHSGNIDKIDKISITFIDKHQNKVFLEGSVNVKYMQGKAIATHSIFRDITKQLQIEKLYSRKNKFSRFFMIVLP